MSGAGSQEVVKLRVEAEMLKQLMLMSLLVFGGLQGADQGGRAPSLRRTDSTESTESFWAAMDTVDADSKRGDLPDADAVFEEVDDRQPSSLPDADEVFGEDSSASEDESTGRGAKRALEAGAQSVPQRRRIASGAAAGAAVVARVCQWVGCTDRQVFATDQEFYDHVNGHLGGQKQCQWGDCKYDFPRPSDLKVHMRTHTGNKPFACEFPGCDWKFAQSSSLRGHMRSHTGEKPFVCEVLDCGRGFSQRCNFERHMRIHTGERPYVCNVPGCDASFSQHDHLKKHKNCVHKLG